MLKRILIAACLAMTGMTTQASIIEYNGYSRDESSNVVYGGDLEWLKWDATRDMSISQALAKNNGWRVASEGEMVKLLNAFTYGWDLWTDIINEDVSLIDSYTSWTENSRHNDFMKLFGKTVTLCNVLVGGTCDDQYEGTRAIFGDITLDGFASQIMIADDYTSFGVKHDAVFTVDANNVDSTAWRNTDTGVALVRDIHLGEIHKIAVVSSVPEPTALSLLALGLGGLLFRRRRQALHA